MAISQNGDEPGMAHSEGSRPGSIFAFLPAHSGSRAAAVAQQLSRTLSEGLGVTVLLADFDRSAFSVWNAAESPKRLDEHTWSSFVCEVDSIQVLNAREVRPRQLGRLVEYARQHVHIVCADLTAAPDAQAKEILRAADAIFLVTGSDTASLQGVHEEMDWLRSTVFSNKDVSDRCALLLEHAPNGASAMEAEERTGVPVCGLVENTAQILQLATWLAANALDQPGEIVELAQAG
jgi:Flp pilus assembly CpaE family ATPase